MTFSASLKNSVNIVRHQYYVSMMLSRSLGPAKRVLDYFSNQLKAKLRVNGATVVYDGVALRFPRNVGMGYCSSIFWDGVNGYEPVTWKVIRHYLGQARTFIDIGSNIGFYSVMAKKIRPEIGVWSFEPVPGIFKKNLLFHEINGLSAENVLNAGVGDECGRAILYLPLFSGGIEEEMTATLRKDSWQSSKEHVEYTVDTVTLDHFFAEKNIRGKVLIKIDVEDFEARVLKSAPQVLTFIRPIIVCEILPREHGNSDTFEVLHSSNYTVFGISSCGLIRFCGQDFTGKRTFTDFLLVPAEIAPSGNYLSHENLDAIHWV